MASTSDSDKWDTVSSPAYLRLRDSARIRRTSARTTEVDHSDGRVSATVRPDVIRTTVSVSGKETQ